eukprot:GHVU01029348.1.p1 GENE.GHVU01029348.1~~GHVU01029348.1.p1  ORF type:complete len:292 (-),score=44.79 GHVU01029348.1:438-1313(-)
MGKKKVSKAQPVAKANPEGGGKGTRNYPAPFQHASYLLQLATLLSREGAPCAARDCISTLRELSRKHVLRLTPGVKRTFCRGCSCVAVEGETCHVRVLSGWRRPIRGGDDGGQLPDGGSNTANQPPGQHQQHQQNQRPERHEGASVDVRLHDSSAAPSAPEAEGSAIIEEGVQRGSRRAAPAPVIEQPPPTADARREGGEKGPSDESQGSPLGSLLGPGAPRPDSGMMMGDSDAAAAAEGEGANRQVAACAVAAALPLPVGGGKRNLESTLVVTTCRECGRKAQYQIALPN